MQVEQVTGPMAYHGEGSVWSARWDGLRWVDMLASDILSLAADDTIGRRHVGNIAADHKQPFDARSLDSFDQNSRLH